MHCCDRWAYTSTPGSIHSSEYLLSKCTVFTPVVVVDDIRCMITMYTVIVVVCTCIILYHLCTCYYSYM